MGGLWFAVHIQTCSLSLFSNVPRSSPQCVQTYCEHSFQVIEVNDEEFTEASFAASKENEGGKEVEFSEEDTITIGKGANAIVLTIKELVDHTALNLFLRYKVHIP